MPKSPAQACPRALLRDPIEPRNYLADSVERAALVDLRLAAALSQSEAADWCGVSLRTWQRMEAGQRPVCGASARLLAILGGAMPWPGFEDWKVTRGVLYAPENPYHGIGPADVRAVHYWRELWLEARRVLEADRARVLEGEPASIVRAQHHRRAWPVRVRYLTTRPRRPAPVITQARAHRRRRRQQHGS